MLRSIRARGARFGFWLLDCSSRTWGAFWGTVLVCCLYAAWNSWLGRPFDPYPYIFLTLLVTLAGYLQNVVIMITGRANDIVQARQEETQRRQLQHMQRLLESQRDQSTVLIRQSEMLIRLVERLPEMVSEEIADAEDRATERCSGDAGRADLESDHQWAPSAAASQGAGSIEDRIAS